MPETLSMGCDLQVNRAREVLERYRNLNAAHRCAKEALEVAQRLESGYMQAHAELLIGRLALTAGHATEAERYIHDAIGHLGTKGFTLTIPECLDILAAIAATQENFE